MCVVLPAHVLVNLKKRTSHKDKKLCLECGYIGRVGVVSVEHSHIKAFFTGLLFFIIATISGVYGWFISPFLFFLFWGVGAWLFSKTTLECPNCNHNFLMR
ncbi:hypothetical protein [Methylophilus sp. DW102]|uniref:hypothetical protein n=1 Tax=Methylophilus sp. DW102 TaxID=3095607 RepID=UPI0030906396|nr:hypothetical protein MTDW_26420 [Methylophilus sp. DW102]